MWIGGGTRGQTSAGRRHPPPPIYSYATATQTYMGIKCASGVLGNHYTLLTLDVEHNGGIGVTWNKMTKSHTYHYTAMSDL